MAYPWDEANAILDRIGCPPGDEPGKTTYDRILLAGDRLMMRPEGEPDTADLVGRINEICDRAGIADGDVVDRVEALQVRSAHQRHRIKELKADLEAERAQLDAKPKRTDAVNLALAVLYEQFRLTGATKEMQLAAAVLREAFA